eukprot:TRINITY_DN16791_c0_g5_i1.p1 TRINITY_DN16791_c0_g5~~TRINITY_DN16791_c0_g5_i1.p1  ORF type:complete len:144 (-),score=24.21 TRINITY_DN16791_c0_g5_i1:205-636(-)
MLGWLVVWMCVVEGLIEMERSVIFELAEGIYGPTIRNNTSIDPCVDWSKWLRCDGSLSTIIELSIHSYSGTLTNNIQYLSNLTSITYFYTKLSGTIPESIGRLSKLQKIMLMLNELSDLFITDGTFSGTIPQSLGTLTNLKRM